MIDNKVGDPRQYRDDVFPSRRRAEAVARARAEWLAAMAGLRVEALTGSGHYLITGWHSLDGARTLEVEECEDGACLGIAYDSMY